MVDMPTCAIVYRSSLPMRQRRAPAAGEPAADAMRLTGDCAFSLLGKVAVSAPLLNCASTLSSWTS